MKLVAFGNGNSSLVWALDLFQVTLSMSVADEVDRDFSFFRFRSKFFLFLDAIDWILFQLILRFWYSAWPIFSQFNNSIHHILFFFSSHWFFFSKFSPFTITKLTNQMENRSILTFDKIYNKKLIFSFFLSKSCVRFVVTVVVIDG